jgi:ATP-dependent Clp protease ATP-binding subunit ClpB
MGVEATTIGGEIGALLEAQPRISGPGAEAGKIRVTQRFQRVFVVASDEASYLTGQSIHVDGGWEGK